jgi:protein-L-isoaspartate(D-aspartate) O-methyltransferase
VHTSALRTTLAHAAPTEASLTSEKKKRILDVGSGSGYTTHLLAEAAGPDAVVVGIEHIQQLRDLGERNLQKSARGRELLDGGRLCL